MVGQPGERGWPVGTVVLEVGFVEPGLRVGIGASRAVVKRHRHDNGIAVTEVERVRIAGSSNVLGDSEWLSCTRVALLDERWRPITFQVNGGRGPGDVGRRCV